MPPVRSPGYYTGLANLEAQGLTQLYSAVTNTVSQFVETVRVAGTQAVRQQQVFAEALVAEYNKGAFRDRMIKVHSEVGQLAQAATLASYEASLASGRHSPPYRINALRPENRRYAGGMLAEAIASPEFYRATYDGILFGNEELLWERARQWHRLNFGALPAAGTSNRAITASWGGASITLAAVGEPSAPFSIPAGRWFGPEFYPLGELPIGFLPNRRNTTNDPNLGQRQARKPTQGIEAWNFLDAGLETIANELPPAYDAAHIAAWERARDRSQGVISRLATATINTPVLIAPSISSVALRADLPRSFE